MGLVEIKYKEYGIHWISWKTLNKKNRNNRLNRGETFNFQKFHMNQKLKEGYSRYM
jgi:hypothetical protein